jgi:hypothetical protein
MPQHFTVKQESPGLVAVNLTGRIGPKEWGAALHELAAHLPAGRRSSILVSGDDFEGWGTGEWDDFDFRHEYDPRIGRIAIVADKRWEDQALMFAGKGLRKVEIEFFTPGEMDRARQWLAACPQGVPS